MTQQNAANIKVMVVVGTRPEAIKMAPVIKQLNNTQGVDETLCVTGQHREMLDQVLELFDLVPDFKLDIMKPGQGLGDVTANILKALAELFAEYKPDRIMVHGDTNTCMSTCLAAYYAQIPVSHVEAGLRTHNIYSPWPEEANRQIARVLTDRHYAPTELAKENLLAESVSESSILVTGNTVIDALFMTVKRMESDSSLAAQLEEKFSFLNKSKKLILVTGHRRENFGKGFLDLCHALLDISQREDVEIIYPVHLNPNVKKPVHEILGGRPNIFLVEPKDYIDFVYLMNRSHHIITDSGGVQEEAPSLGKPVLVMRDTTERPEAVEAGTVKLVGTDRGKIVSTSQSLLEDSDMYRRMSETANPYGDGHSARRITEDLLS